MCLLHRVSAAEFSYQEILIDDVKYFINSPTRWGKTEWYQAEWASIAIVGTALVIDRPMRDEMRHHNSSNTYVTQVERFGSQYALGIVSGFYLTGILTDNNKSILVAQDEITASLIASGIITPAIKLAAGRNRPRDDTGIYHFKPFSNANSSFPSGHATEAFVLASVIANHYDENWVTCTSYSIASLVGLARIYHHAHFASDVLAGAMIGTLVGKSVVNHNADLRSSKLNLLPVVDRDLIGIRISGRF